MFKKLIITLSLVQATFGLFDLISPNSVYASEKVAKAIKNYWTCSMHPEVHAAGPGQCPICHMDLIKKEEKEIANESKINDRKSIALDQKSFELSGAKLYTVKKGDFNYQIKTFGKMNGGNNFTLYVSEKDQRFVKANHQVTLKVPSLDLLEFNGTITKVDTYIDPMGRTIRVDGVATNLKEALRAETSLLGTIQFKKVNIIKVPEEAVLHSGEKDYVFRLDKVKSVLNPVTVKLGLISGGEIEIIDGVNEGDVVTTHANFLIDSESRMQFNRE